MNYTHRGHAVIHTEDSDYTILVCLRYFGMPGLVSGPKLPYSYSNITNDKQITLKVFLTNDLNESLI